MHRPTSTIEVTGHPRPPDGVVLCGGAGRRVGGRDKGLLTVGAIPAVAIAARLLRSSCGTVFISANRNLDRYRALALGPVLPDRRSGHPGPLAGLESVAAAMSSDRLLVMPCDLPELDGEVLPALLQTLDADGTADAVYAATAGRDHYLVAALRARALASVAAALDGRDRAVGSWLRGLRARRVLFEGAAAAGFGNRNTSDDWENA